MKYLIAVLILSGTVPKTYKPKIICEKNVCVKVYKTSE